MKEKLIVFLGVMVVVYLVAGTIAVEHDIDLIRCKASFESEVNEIEGREFAMNLAGGGNEYFSDAIKDAEKNPNFPFDGTLDQIVQQRDAILSRKSVLMLGEWRTQIKAGMRESFTGAIYIPLNPWKLRFK